jgi:hypothetical protein
MPLPPDYYSRLNEPARNGVAVVAAGTDLPGGVCRSIHVGATGGTLTVVFADGDTAAPITMDVAANTTYPWALRRVTNLGACTGVRALY